MHRHLYFTFNTRLGKWRLNGGRSNLTHFYVTLRFVGQHASAEKTWGGGLRKRAAKKVSEFAGSYIRDQLREISFYRKVHPPEAVSKEHCQRSVNHDTQVRIVDI